MVRSMEGWIQSRLALAVLIVAVALIRPVRAQAPSQESQPAAEATATSSPPSDDSALRKELDELVAAMRALKSPSADDVSAMDARIDALTTRLAAAGQQLEACALNLSWGIRLGTRRVHAQAALHALDRAETQARIRGKPDSLAEIALGRARVLRTLRRYDEALAQLEQATNGSDKPGNEKHRASIAWNRGLILEVLGRYAEALAEFDVAESAYQALGSDAGVASMALHRGSVLRSLGRYAEALIQLARAAELYAKLGDEPSLAEVCENRGTVLSELTRYDEALAEYDKAARGFQAAGDEDSLAGIVRNRGVVFCELSRYADALREYDQAASVFERLGNEGSLAGVFQNRGSAFFYLGRYEEALAQFERAARVYEKLGDENRLAMIAANRGNVFQFLSRQEEAVVEYDKAASVFEKRGDEAALAGIALNRGSALLMLAREGDALTELDKAARLFGRLGVEGRVAEVAQNRGAVLDALSRHAEALAEFSAAAVVYERLGDAESLAGVALNRGITFDSLSRHADALAEYDKAEPVFRKLGNDESRAHLAIQRGKALLSLARPAEALDQFAEARARIESSLQSQVQKLGETSSSAYRAGFRPVVADALKAAAAIPELSDAQRNTAYRIVDTFVGLGTAELIAERGTLPGIDLPEDQRRRLEELELDSRRAIGVRDRLARTSPDASADERDAREEELSHVVKTLRQLESDRAALIDRARQRQHVATGIRYPTAATTAEVQSELNPGVALLEFVVAGDAVFAFVTTHSQQHLVPLGEAASIVEDVGQVRAELTGPRAARPDEDRLRRLGTRLVEPVLAVAKATAVIETLLIAAHGELALIPFEILLVPNPKNPAATTALVREYEVAYVHSGTVMRAMKLDAAGRARSDGLDFVGFGLPLDAEVDGSDDRPDPSLVLRGPLTRVPLPGSATEVLTIVKRHFASDEAERASISGALRTLDDDPSGSKLESVRGRRFKLLLRGDATEAALKNDPQVRTARILHLACHGEADFTSPALSRLVLARSKRIEAATGENGYVYLGELRDVRITAELLVLSACSTNAGVLHPVEGITGLSRMGLAAGAEAVLSTFWRVDDRAAAEIMVDFYDAWLKDGKTRIRALCEAKRKAMERGVPVSTWSAYALWDARTM